MRKEAIMTNKKTTVFLTVLVLCLSMIISSCSGKAPVVGDVDVDLTLLSSTMVYSEVYNMIYKPDSYLGKMIRMSGTYTSMTDPDTGNVYHACVIADATACCQQGIEFVLAEGYSYPGKEGEEITVVGVLEQYTEGQYTYLHLVDAVRE